MQLAQYRDEGRHPRPARDKQTRPLIIDRAPNLVDDQFVARADMLQFIGHAVMIGVELDRELQVIPIVQRCKSERPQLFFQSRFIDGNISGLTGYKGIPGRFFDIKLFDVMRYHLRLQYFNNVLFHDLNFELPGLI